MKKLKEFVKFDVVKFIKGKEFTVKEIKENFEYKDGNRTGNVKGSIIKLLITKDETIYSDGSQGVNLFEVLNLKTPYLINQLAELKQGDKIDIRQFGQLTGVVYGQYANELSITATPKNVND
jgi:hypothetical protein